MSPKPKGINKTIKLKPIKYSCWNVSVAEQNRSKVGEGRVLLGREEIFWPPHLAWHLSRSFCRKREKGATIFHEPDSGLVAYHFNYLSNSARWAQLDPFFR